MIINQLSQPETINQNLADLVHSKFVEAQDTAAINVDLAAELVRDAAAQLITAGEARAALGYSPMVVLEVDVNQQVRPFDPLATRAQEETVNQFLAGSFYTTKWGINFKSPDGKRIVVAWDNRIIKIAHYPDDLVIK